MKNIGLIFTLAILMAVAVSPLHGQQDRDNITQPTIKQIPVCEALYHEGEVIAVRGLIVGKISKISVFEDGRVTGDLWAFYIDENPGDKRMFKLRTRILVLYEGNKDLAKLDAARPIEITGIATSRLGKIWALSFVTGLNLEAGFKELRIEATEVRQAD